MAFEKKNHYETEGILTMAMYQMLLLREDRRRKGKDTYGVTLWLWKEKYYKAIAGRSATTRTGLEISLMGLFLFNLRKTHPI